MFYVVGFILGAGCVTMLGVSLLEDHKRRVVVPITAVCALVSGVLTAWAFDYFIHFASRTG